MPSVVDPYHVLQVRRDATPGEIQQNYKRLALWHHPSRTLQVDAAERSRRSHVFNVLAACYETLIDKDIRSRCDAHLKEEYTGNHQFGGLFQQQKQQPAPPLSTVSSSSKSNGNHQFGALFQQPKQQPAPPLSTVSSSSKSTSSSDEDETTTLASKSTAGASRIIKQIQPFNLDLLFCGYNSASHDHHKQKSSGSTEEEPQGGEIHYSEQETNRLFGGPLSLLYRARRWKPFIDSMVVFADVFGSSLELLPHHEGLPETSLQPIYQPPSSSAWSGSSEKLPDGTIVFTTTRRLHDRVLQRTETVRVVNGKRQVQISVTSEPIQKEEEEEHSFCLMWLCLPECCFDDPKE
jgi:hypothetical protein